MDRTAELHVTAEVAEDRYPVDVVELDAEAQRLPDEEEVTAWKLRAWDDPDLERAFLDRSLIAVSADEIGDMTNPASRRELVARLRAAFPDRTEQAIGTFVRYWQSFRDGMQRGDLVVVPLSKRRLAIGRIIGDYAYQSPAVEPEPRLRHTRAVQWLGVVDRDELDADLRRVVNSPGTIGRIHATAAAPRLRSVVEGP